MQMLRSEGVTVEVSTLDVAQRSEAQQLLALCEALAPLGGIFHLAMVLEDRLIAKHVSLFSHLPCQLLCPACSHGGIFHLAMVLENCLIAKHVCATMAAPSLENV